MSSNRLRVRDVLLASSMLLFLAACTTTTTITDFDEAPVRGGSGQDRSRGDDGAAPRYTVQRGDTLYAIAFRNRLDLRELIAWNSLAEPYTIYPGQELRIGNAPPQRSAPSRSTRDSRDTRVARRVDAESAPPPQRNVPPPAPEEPGRVALGRLPVAEASPRVEDRGESAADAARTRGEDERDGFAARGEDASSGGERGVQPRRERSRADSNRGDASDRSSVPVSELAALPIATDDPIREARDDSASAPLADSTGRDAGGPVPPTASRSVPVAAAATVIPATPVEPERDVGPIRSAPMRVAGGIGWRWPSSATLVGRFSTDDDARQGIRLQGPAGSPVTASADGEVVYSGNGLVGLGELVIIKHGSEYLSAYGLNRKRLVTEGQQVKAGQLVAEMGNSAGVAGLLHFEVRRNGRPIDPLTVLPPR